MVGFKNLTWHLSLFLVKALPVLVMNSVGF